MSALPTQQESLSMSKASLTPKKLLNTWDYYQREVVGIPQQQAFKEISALCDVAFDTDRMSKARKIDDPQWKKQMRKDVLIWVLEQHGINTIPLDENTIESIVDMLS